MNIYVFRFAMSTHYSLRENRVVFRETILGQLFTVANNDAHQIEVLKHLYLSSYAGIA